MNERSAIEKVRLARHPNRPYTLDLVNSIFEDFFELHGDRRFADDQALVAGFARIDQHEVAVIGQQKGRDTKQRHLRNFGMPKPEGYRKALRVMQLAEKFNRSIITFIDTPGAYPGIDAEERGQAEAIAFNLREMAALSVPVITVVLGEGGSGGALAIGLADHVIMLENAVYSVISPEGCAAILWKDAAQSDLAAESLKLTAQDLLGLGLIDQIVAEPTDWNSTEYNESSPNLSLLKQTLIKNLTDLKSLETKLLQQNRWRKFRKMGRWLESNTVPASASSPSQQVI